MMPQGLAHGFLLLFASRFGMIVLRAGWTRCSGSGCARHAGAQSRRGFRAGAATARSLGWVIAPLVSGVVASGLGTRSVFVGGFLFFCIVPLISVVVKKLNAPDRSSGDSRT